jgi:hypothetical protein
MFRLFSLFLLFVALPASAQQPTWYLLAREIGCVDLQLLVRMEKLSRAPVSPEDFAQMLRERGEEVILGPLADAPAEFIGKVVQVKYGSGKAPIFVKEEICRTIEPGR